LSSKRIRLNGLNNGVDLWELAREKAGMHRYSTLFTAQDVRDFLSAEKKIQEAVEWCRKTGVTRVFIESFRDAYQAERENLLQAKKVFQNNGFQVSGCVTTTRVGKVSTGWNLISCYTDIATQKHLQEIFEYTASIFDEIMIDDFLFTDCSCPECDEARKKGMVIIGDEKYPVQGEAWRDYRCELMFRLSDDRILKPVRRINPKAKVIIKYPQWYEMFQDRGYDVKRETEIFDMIWVGTETRNYNDARWGGVVQYAAYFIMRWLGEIGGEKCGGGWFDPYGTTEETYVEQARQTILGGARESLLFCYGSLREGARATGPENVSALRRNMPELLEVAVNVRKRKPIGVNAYKPPNSHPGRESRVFDFVGMLGIPLVPCHEFPKKARAAFFSFHSLEDPGLTMNLEKLVAQGAPVIITDGLADMVRGKVKLDLQNVEILSVNGNPKSLLDMPEKEINHIRNKVLKPFGVEFEAPTWTGLYIYHDGSWVIENFRDEPVSVVLNGRRIRIEPRDWLYEWK
jgi:hypothetical protein